MLSGGALSYLASFPLPGDLLFLLLTMMMTMKRTKRMSMSLGQGKAKD
jgi:hypothetical protein